MRKLAITTLVWFSLFVGACHQQSTQPSLMDSLLNTESVLVSGMETLKMAIDLGRVDTNSDEYGMVYDGLAQANEIMDSAWAAYRTGDMGGAEVARSVAMSTYMTIRPMLMKMAGEDP